MKPSASRSASRARCPHCGNAFDCGKHAQPFNCWCAEMPVVPLERLKADGRCLCPGCLAAEMARTVRGAPDVSDA